MRTRLVMLCTILMIAVLASASIADSKATSTAFESFWKSESPIRVPVTAGENGSVTLQFPAMPQKKGATPVIRFKAYLKTAQHAGWSHYLNVSLNGKALGMNAGGTAYRLINRAKVISTQFGSDAMYNNDTLLTFFSPNGNEVDPRVNSDREEGCWYMMDVSDLTNRVVVGWDDRIESQEPNKITFLNTYKFLSSGETASCKEFIVEDLEAGYVPDSEVNKLRPADLVSVKPASGPTIATGDGSITVGADGAFELKVGGDSYHFAGLYSYPGKEKIQYNSMGMPSVSAPDWKITRSLSRDRKKITAKGEWKDYTVTRSIVADGGKFRIYDKISNKTDKPLGMEIRYNAITADKFTNDNVFLCGSGSLIGTDNCGTNPSVYIKQPKSSMGLVVEDTLFRLQMEVLRRDNSIEYTSKHFGLAPRKSYTVEWTIYPSQSTDYFDFVNRVRKDWNVNYTLVGPCPFGDDHPVPGRKGLLYAMQPWYDYDSKNKMLTPDTYTAILRPKVEKLLAEQPDAIPMGMLNTNLVPYDTTVSGGKVPQGTMLNGDRNRTGYGLELTPEQTEFIKKTKWWDSEIKTADGRALIDTYYAPAPYSNLLVYPVVGNYQYKFMLSEIDLLMDRVGMKGVYMDQFNLAGISLKQPGRCDYSKWDGHTVDLKPNGEIERMFTDGTYVGASARAGILRHIIDKGGVAMINGHPVDKESRGIPVQSFAESEWDLSSAEDLLSYNEPPYMPSITEGLLSSPIALGIRPDRFGQFGKDHFAEIIHKWVVTCLKNGSVYCYYAHTIPTEGPGAGEYGIINHMFPFTPIELHEGWLVGKERILTAKSGSFFWNHSVEPEVLAFDLKGHQIKPQSLVMEKKGNGWQVGLGIRDWQETAVIKDPAEK